MDERVMLVCSATGSTIGYFAPEVVEGLRAASNGKHVLVNNDATLVTVWVIDGDILSEEYASGRYLICSHCGEIIDTANNWDFNEDEYGTYCGRCCSELLTYCDRCDSWNPKDETVVVHTGFDSQYTEHWCRDCVEGRAFICEVCGEAHELRAQVHVPNPENPICRSCCERLYFHCDRCGDFFSREEQHNHDELTGDSLCNSCMESVTEWRNRPVECGHCHNTVRQVDIFEVHSHEHYQTIRLCPDCQREHVSRCSICGGNFYTSEEHPATTLANGNIVCPHCAHTRTFTCADCGGLFHRTERFSHDGVNYCRNCESRHRPIQVITGYHRYGGNSSQVWKFRSLEELDMFKTNRRENTYTDDEFGIFFYRCSIPPTVLDSLQVIGAGTTEYNGLYIGMDNSFDGSRIIFFFTADGRVDFRELVKDLAAVFKTRIELRQIGVRDETKILGGIGICGRPLCCSQFLGDFEPVSIKMAKEQNLSLNPTKISGVCGRLMCCLRFEHELYEEELAKLPKLDALVETPDGRGIVCELSPLCGLVKVRFPGDHYTVRTYAKDSVKIIANTKKEQKELRDAEEKSSPNKDS